MSDKLTLRSICRMNEEELFQSIFSSPEKLEDNYEALVSVLVAEDEEINDILGKSISKVGFHHFMDIFHKAVEMDIRDTIKMNVTGERHRVGVGASVGAFIAGHYLDLGEYENIYSDVDSYVVEACSLPEGNPLIHKALFCARGFEILEVNTPLLANLLDTAIHIQVRAALFNAKDQKTLDLGDSLQRLRASQVIEMVEYTGSFTEESDQETFKTIIDKMEEYLGDRKYSDVGKLWFPSLNIMSKRNSSRKISKLVEGIIEDRIRDKKELEDEFDTGIPTNKDGNTLQ